MTHVSEPHPIHVLTLTPFYPSQSDEVDGTFVAEPLEHFPSFKIDTTVIAAKPRSWGTFEIGDRVPQAIWVRYPQLPGRAAYGSWGLLLYTRLARVVSRLHREHHIDLIHAHSALPCGHAAALLSRQLNIPFVVTAHGLDVFSTQREKGVSRRFVDHCSRFVYRKADMNICVSDAVRRALVNVLRDSTRTTVIYNGVNTFLFTPPVNDNGDSTPRILSVGRLISSKGQELVLRAVAEIIQKYPHLQYEIVDDGPERSHLVALAHKLKIAKRVKFLSRQNRQFVAEAMKRCTIFALPSKDEAMGCVYLEAMATARPIIGCRQQGIEEIVRHGENGWLIQPDNLQEMVNALDILLGNASLRNRMGREARKTTIESLTLQHQAERLNQLYRQCLGLTNSV